MRFLGTSLADSRGDTIVEVLISLAIISLVLVAAYASVRRNTEQTQSTQEHMTALQLAQGQVEFLRAARGIPTGKTCFDSSGAATTGAGCTVGLANGAQYKLTVTPDVPSSTYTVQAVWTGLSAKTNDDTKVTLYYKVVR